MKGRRTLGLLLPVMAALALVALLLVAGRVVAGPHRQELAHYRSGAVHASSGWVPINPGQTITFTHDLGGSPDDYAVDLWFLDAAPGGYGINHRCAGGLEVDGKFYGAHWQNLTDTTIEVFRREDDTLADQVRVNVWIPDPPAWDSRWVDISLDETKILTHTIGGDPDEYTVGLWFKDTDGIGINTRCYGGLAKGGNLFGANAGGNFFGANWENLTDTTINVFRHSDDIFADQVRVRIFVPEPPAWDSGWRDINPRQTITLTHNLGGNLNLYVVRGESRDTCPDGIGINHRFAGGWEWLGHFFGANWENLTNTTINLFRRPDDGVADQVRVRIWVREFKIYLPIVSKNYP